MNSLLHCSMCWDIPNEYYTVHPKQCLEEFTLSYLDVSFSITGLSLSDADIICLTCGSKLKNAYDEKIKSSTLNTNNICIDSSGDKYFGTKKNNKIVNIGHKNKENEKRRTYLCFRCDSKYYTRADLDKHKRKKHGICDKCGKRFSTIEDVIEHIEIDHNVTNYFYNTPIGINSP